MCNITGQRSTGAILYILGLLVAGVMFIVIGAEYNANDTNNDDLRTYFWVYAIAMLVGTIGLVLDNGERFCGDDEFKSVDYFGGLLTVVAGFAWASFGAGLAHFYEDGQYWVGGVQGGTISTDAATERKSMAYLSGVASLVYLGGSLFILKKIICCEGCECGMEFINSMINMFFMIILTVGWFWYADRLEKELGTAAGDKDRRNAAYMIGIVYIFLGVSGVLKILDVFMGGPKEPKEPSYDDQERYDEPKGGYGNERPSYGQQGGGYGAEDTTTGYGNQPQQGY